MVLGLDMGFCLGNSRKIVFGVAEEAKARAKWCSGRFAPLGNAGVLRCAQNDERETTSNSNRQRQQQRQRQKQILRLRRRMTTKKQEPRQDRGQSKGNSKDRWIWAAYIPTHDDETVMDGAPDPLGRVEENRQRRRRWFYVMSYVVPHPAQEAARGWGTRLLWVEQATATADFYASLRNDK